MQFDKHDPFKIGSYERLTLEAFYISFRNPLRMPRYIDKTDQSIFSKNSQLSVGLFLRN